MIEFVIAKKEHIPIIRGLSEEVWPDTFASILSAQQIDYMMEMMYSFASLERQMMDGQQYIIARIGSQNVGYMSYEIDAEDSGKTKIHKLYISPKHQRRGVGRAMVNYVAQKAQEANNEALFLTVNRHNEKAISFYKKKKFFIAREEIKDIGNGFVMDDYIFELTLNQPHL